MRAGHAEVPADEDAAEVQLRPRRLPQPLQSGPPPHQQRDIQGATLNRAAGQWTVREMSEQCRLVTWPPPLPRTIARLETELRLDEMIQAVGVVDNRSLNQHARVGVRSVVCRSLPDGDAMCSYQASACLPNAQATSPNGWCARETRFIHIGGREVPAVPGSESWAMSRPAAQAD